MTVILFWNTTTTCNQALYLIREEIDYSVDNMGDISELVSEGFEYQSGTNGSFLDATEFNQLVSLSKTVPT